MITTKYPRKQHGFVPYVSQAHRLADAVDRPERLSGSVKNMPASAPEERLAIELGRRRKVYYFRMALGASRNMPGFKELDFLIQDAPGMYYAVEVDTAFTHRGKQEADKLHDAIVLGDLRKNNINVYPQVFHLDGDSDLANPQATKETLGRLLS